MVCHTTIYKIAKCLKLIERAITTIMIAKKKNKNQNISNLFDALKVTENEKKSSQRAIAKTQTIRYN